MSQRRRNVRTRKPRCIQASGHAQSSGSEISALHSLPRAYSWIEQRSHFPAMKNWFKFALLLVPALAPGQQTVAPTTGEATSPSRGENTSDYNLVQSWELGYRFATVGGDDGKYRSDVNYGNGVRLLSSYLTINSRD